MNTSELIEFLALGQKDASDLLDEIDPKIKRQFKKACKDLANIVDKVRLTYPDTNIYVQEDQPLLLLGESHTNHIGRQPTPNREIEACSDSSLSGKIGGGAW